MNSNMMARLAPHGAFLVFSFLVLYILLAPAEDHESNPWTKMAWTEAQQNGPNAPALITPLDKAQIHDANVTFEWERPVGYAANSIYKVQIVKHDEGVTGPYRTPHFAGKVLSFTVQGKEELDLAELEKDVYPAEDHLELGEYYYWRVEAIDNTTHSSWSTVGSFYTGTTNQLGKTLLEENGIVLMVLGGVLISTMIAGVFLAKEEDAQPILPEYSPEEVLTAPAPGEPGYEDRGGVL